MDNRTNTVEDSQSTPEHPAGKVGGPGFTNASDADITATPGGLRKAMLDSEHDAHVSAGVDPQRAQALSDASQALRSAGEQWRSRMNQGAQSLRSTVATHPLALGLVALGVALGVAALIRSRSSER